MMRFLATVLAAGLVGVSAASAQPGPDTVPVQRAYSSDQDDHVLTIDPRELRDLGRQGYRNEGVVFLLATSGGPGLVPLYRFSERGGGHVYSTNPRVGPGQRSEGLMGYLATQPGTGLVPLYAFYNNVSNRWFYTTDYYGEGFRRKGYGRESIVGYVIPTN